jgi:hypothetical protein
MSRRPTGARLPALGLQNVLAVAPRHCDCCGGRWACSRGCTSLVCPEWISYRSGGAPDSPCPHSAGRQPAGPVPASTIAGPATHRSTRSISRPDGAAT